MRERTVAGAGSRQKNRAKELRPDRLEQEVFGERFIAELAGFIEECGKVGGIGEALEAKAALHGTHHGIGRLLRDIPQRAFGAWVESHDCCAITLRFLESVTQEG